METEFKSEYRYLKIWRLIGLLLVVSLIVVSLVPVTLKVSTSHADKIGHVLAYTCLMFWFVQIYARENHRWFALGFIAMGAGLEGLQHLTGYRYAEFADMIANTIGVLIGWGLFYTPFGKILGFFDQLFRRQPVSPPD